MKKRKARVIWVVDYDDYQGVWKREPPKYMFDVYDVVKFKEVL